MFLSILLSLIFFFYNSSKEWQIESDEILKENGHV